MRTITIAAVAALTVACTPAHAFWGGGNDGSTINNPSANATAHGGKGGKGGNASAKQSQGQSQGQSQKQAQGQAQGQSQSSSNVNLQGNSQSVNIENPAFTWGVFGQISSMANDRCGRVAFGVPFSAHTCNIIMEAENLAAMLEPVYGKAFAAQQALRHVADNDRTMRTTLRRAGVIE